MPFKGAPEALAQVLAGEIDFYFCPIAPALPMLKDGRLAAIAVGSNRRASALPDVPTTLEAGYANSDYNFWVGMFVPAKTPREIVARLNQETLKAMQAPEVAQRLARLGAEPMPMTPEQFDAYLRAEVAAERRRSWRSRNQSQLDLAVLQCSWYVQVAAVERERRAELHDALELVVVRPSPRSSGRRGSAAPRTGAGRSSCPVGGMPSQGRGAWRWRRSRRSRIRPR